MPNETSVFAWKYDLPPWAYQAIPKGNNKEQELLWLTEEV